MSIQNFTLYSFSNFTLRQSYTLTQLKPSCATYTGKVWSHRYSEIYIYIYINTCENNEIQWIICGRKMSSRMSSGKRRKGVTRLFTSRYSTCTPRFVGDNFSSSHFIHVYIVTLFFYHPRYWTVLRAFHWRSMSLYVIMETRDIRGCVANVNTLHKVSSCISAKWEVTRYIYLDLCVYDFFI